MVSLSFTDKISNTIIDKNLNHNITPTAVKSDLRSIFSIETY